jgi:hypothetical protein
MYTVQRSRFNCHSLGTAKKKRTREVAKHAIKIRVYENRDLGHACHSSALLERKKNNFAS